MTRARGAPDLAVPVGGAGPATWGGAVLMVAVALTTALAARQSAGAARLAAAADWATVALPRDGSDERDAAAVIAHLRTMPGVIGVRTVRTTAADDGAWERRVVVVEARPAGAVDPALVARILPDAAVARADPGIAAEAETRRRWAVAGGLLSLLLAAGGWPLGRLAAGRVRARHDAWLTLATDLGASLAQRRLAIAAPVARGLRVAVAVGLVAALPVILWSIARGGATMWLAPALACQAGLLLAAGTLGARWP